MDFSFETQGANTYLTYRVGENDALDSLSLGMVTNNRIQGIAPTLFTQMDENRYLKYNVSAKVSVKKFLSGAVARKRFLSVFLGIADSILAAEEYMIDTRALLLDLNYIFVDVTTCETLLICLPLANSESLAVDMSAFFKGIIFDTQYDLNDHNDYVAKIISYMNGSDIFSLCGFRDMIKQLMDGQKGNTGSLASAPPAPPVLPAPPAPTMPATLPPTPPVLHTPPVLPAPPPAKKDTPGALRAASSKNTAHNADGQKQKNISFFHLLMHYDQKTKEAYAAQKKTKKNAVPAKPTSLSKSNQAAVGKPSAFAIPGAIAPMSPLPDTHQPAVPPSPVPVPVPAPPPTPTPALASPLSASSPSPIFGEATVLSGGSPDATRILNEGSSAAQTAPYLIRIKKNERIDLTKPVFRIGKEKNFVDYHIGDNAAVSRGHAEFMARGGEYFVTDMNSTNHTFVDGVMIQSSVEEKIAHGAKIRLGNEEFEFRLY